jgi:hypothetical protein
MTSEVQAGMGRARERSGALETAEIHRVFIKSLGPLVRDCSDQELETKPLFLKTSAPLPSPIRAYLYTLTYSVAERKQGAYRSQVILPGAVRASGDRAHLDASLGAFLVLGGYEPELDVFCFWDASLQDRAGFPYSKGIQVDDRTIYAAAVNGRSEQVRDQRPGGGRVVRETIIAVRRDLLVQGIRRRWQVTCDRLLGEDQ